MRGTAVLLLAMLGCSSAPASNESDVVVAGSVERLVRALHGMILDYGTRPALVTPEESGSETAPPFVAIGSEDDAAFDGALIGAAPGDPMAVNGCVFLSRPGELATKRTLDEVWQYAVQHPNALEEGEQAERVFFINGINNSAEDHCDTIRWIARWSSFELVQVVGIYNATTGFAGDVWQSGWDRFSVTIEQTLAGFGGDRLADLHHNKAASALVSVIVHRARAGERTVIYAHSQGGAITSLALHRAARLLADEGIWRETAEGYEADGIFVTSLGSAAPSWPHIRQPGGRSIYQHLVHVHDATPSAFGINMWNWAIDGEARSGGASVWFFDGLQDTLTASDDPNDFGVPVGVPSWEVVDSRIPPAFNTLHPTKYHSALHYLINVVGD